MNDPVLQSSERPVRSHMEGKDIVWRHGKPPNYDIADIKYLNEKSKNWPAGSLEKTVENLVKTWEMESTHKMDAKDWGTVDKQRFRIVVNGKHTFTLKDNIAIGNYNMTLMDSVFYDGQAYSNEKSHEMFRGCFPKGFGWEVTEVYTGPPQVMFSWRHWGDFEGEYEGNPPTGERIELLGFTIATVNKDLKVEKLEVWYDPNLMIAKLKGVVGPCNSRCPLGSAAFK